jgi:hypothetical protein
MLTEHLSAGDVYATTNSFGLESPDPDAVGPALAGMGVGWRISPLRMAHAYLELVRRREEPGVRAVLDGMAESARRGTGAEVDRVLPYPDALVKTGTASCTHTAQGPGDGFAVVLVPADQPQLLLMVREHKVPGARAAKTAAQMLQLIEH